MERIKIQQLKRAIKEAREQCPHPVDREALDRLMKSVLVCPQQFLRITKMYGLVMKIKKQAGITKERNKIDIIQNFQETTVAGY